MEEVSEVGTLNEESGTIMSLCASMHQANPLFKGSGSQCTSNVLMSFIKASTKPLENWSQATLDKILIKGDLLYTNVASLVGQQYLLPDELPSKIPIEGGFCQVTLYESVSGTLFQSDKETYPFQNLEQAITCLEIWNYAFLTVGSKTPLYTIGLLRTNDQPMISVFDSQSRDTSGLSSPDGTAIVTTHPNMRHLLMFIRDLTLSLSLGDSCPFEIVPVSIMVQRTDCMYADSDSTATSASFLGFSDSEIYPDTTRITKDSDTEVSDENIPLTHLKQNAHDDDDDDDSSDDDVPLAQFAGFASTKLESRGSEYTLTKSELHDDDDDDDSSDDDVPLAQFAGFASTNLESSGSEYTLTKTELKLLVRNISSLDTEMKGKSTKLRMDTESKRESRKKKKVNKVGHIRQDKALHWDGVILRTGVHIRQDKALHWDRVILRILGCISK